MTKFKSLVAGALVFFMSGVFAPCLSANEVSQKNNKKTEISLSYSSPFSLFGKDEAQINLSTLTLKYSFWEGKKFESLLGLEASEVVSGPGSYMLSGKLY